MTKISTRATIHPRSNAAFMKLNWQQWTTCSCKPSLRQGQPDFWKVYRHWVNQQEKTK